MANAPVRTKRPSAQPTSNASRELGKVPPQALDLEEAVLGALLIEKEAVNDVIDILHPDSFYKDAHQKIYTSIKDLFSKSEPIDLLTVTEDLRKRGELDLIGGPFYLTQLTGRVGSAANVEFHARIISQKHILRELIRISSSTITDAFDETTDVFDLLDRTESDLFGVAEGNIRKSFDSMSVLIQQAIQRVQELSQKEDGVSGVPTGFSDLDKITSGFQPADMIILAARPGMGKTSFALTIARNTAVDFKKAVAVFSLEMSSLQLVTRLISSETELTSEKLRKGNLESHEWEQLSTKITALSEAPIFIDDTPALSVFELRAKCRRLKAQHDIQMVVIDYLQLMTPGGENKGNREQEISTISRSVKSIAKELSIPVIALSQLSRSVETRQGPKRPVLSDLRESGAIEQDADIVMFLYRPEYYGFTEDEEGNPTDGVTELIIAKHRNGKTDRVNLRFVDHLAKFVNDGDNMMEMLSPLAPNDDFSTNFVKRSSRMNDDFESDDQTPF
ncbi:MAG TPA: replicative DNA helicase [Flavobacteriales bacterium]|jgi:replicative DNA helicase|nr:replicative DNA helicase [Flavobacteriales bacterium]